MNLRCLVVDDEPMARKGLKEYIADVSFLELAGECDSALKAVDFLHKEPVDVLFLDIQMPRMTGLELLRSLPQRPLVILTTAYAGYAVESFELEVFDYLLKPISFERFLKAVNRAKSVLKKETAAYFFIKCDNRLEKIALADVLYAEALQNYVAIHTPGGFLSLTGSAFQETVVQDLFHHLVFQVAAHGNVMPADDHFIPFDS